MLFDKRDAQAMAKKLKATLIDKKGKKHDIAVVKYGGKVVGQFGIRRGSGSLGHDYIPGQIHVTTKQARDLVQCPMSFDDWIALMKEKQLIADGAQSASVGLPSKSC
jgi:phenylacetate-coenzyme A ligase PaaK-like adenylate-forming protein